MSSTPAFAQSEDLATIMKLGSSVHNVKKNCLFKDDTEICQAFQPDSGGVLLFV